MGLAIRVEEIVLTSKETQELLGISRARLSQLVNKKKLIPIKKSIFLLDDVLARKGEQEKLRAKFYRRK